VVRIRNESPVENNGVKMKQAKDEAHLDDSKSTVAPVVIGGSRGALERPDGRAKKSGTCGDIVEFFLSLDGDWVRDVGYRVTGCKNTLACVQAAALLVRGRTLAEAGKMAEPKWIEEMVEGLPKENKHCAEHASETMKNALNMANKASRDPWRKLYRKP
jgi:nitrogen fixation NifU-like protein